MSDAGERVLPTWMTGRVGDDHQATFSDDEPLAVLSVTIRRHRQPAPLGPLARSIDATTRSSAVYVPVRWL